MFLFLQLNVVLASVNRPLTATDKPPLLGEAHEGSEPVVFHREKYLKISRSTVDATIVFNLKPIFDNFENLETYTTAFVSSARTAVENYGDIMKENRPACEDEKERTKYSFKCAMQNQMDGMIDEVEQVERHVNLTREQFKSMIDQVTYQDPKAEEHAKQDNQKPNSHLSSGQRVRRSIVAYANNHYLAKSLSETDFHILQELAYLTTVKHNHPKYTAAGLGLLKRTKRFILFDIFLGFTAWSQQRSINTLKRNVAKLSRHVNENAKNIHFLADQLNMALAVINEHSEALSNLSLEIAALNKTMNTMIVELTDLQMAMVTTIEFERGLNNIRTGILQIQAQLQQVKDSLKIGRASCRERV